jgi:hypothetical protein
MRHWSWTQFAFGVAVGTACNFLVLNFWTLGLSAHVAKVLVVGSACGILAGRFGDDAWRWIVRVIGF